MVDRRKVEIHDPTSLILSVTEANTMTEVSSSKVLAFANRVAWSFFPRPSCSEVVYRDSPMVRLLILVHLLQKKKKQQIIPSAPCLGCRQNRTSPVIWLERFCEDFTASPQCFCCLNKWPQHMKYCHLTNPQAVWGISHIISMYYKTENPISSKKY